MSVEDRLADLEARVRKGELGEYTPYGQQLVKRLETMEEKVDALERQSGERQAIKVDRKVWWGIGLAVGIPLLNFIERNFNIVGKS